MGEQNFERAVRVLEPLELTPETEAQWMELSELALSSNQVAGGLASTTGKGASQAAHAAAKCVLYGCLIWVTPAPDRPLRRAPCRW